METPVSPSAVKRNWASPNSEGIFTRSCKSANIMLYSVHRSWIRLHPEAFEMGLTVTHALSLSPPLVLLSNHIPALILPFASQSRGVQNTRRLNSYDDRSLLRPVLPDWDLHSDGVARLQQLMQGLCLYESVSLFDQVHPSTARTTARNALHKQPDGKQVLCKHVWIPHQRINAGSLTENEI
jgi:hypothetical protein